MVIVSLNASKSHQGEKKSMAFFSRDRGKEVPKRVPPDKSAGAWPSVQENTTGTGNFGKSSCGGTNAENQSLKVQENPREHSVVDNQEDIPTGDRAGIHPLPNALDPQAEMYSVIEMFSKHQSLCTLYECAHDCAVEAVKLSQVSPETEEDLSVHLETYRKSFAIAVAHALEILESYLVNLERFKLINVIAPLYRDKLPRMINE